MGLTGNTMGEWGMGNTDKSPSKTMDSQMPMATGIGGTSRASSRPSQTMNSHQAGATLNIQSLAPTPSPFDGCQSDTTDLTGKVSSFLRSRHGERRLRDIRQKKR